MKQKTKTIILYFLFSLSIIAIINIPLTMVFVDNLNKSPLQTIDKSNIKPEKGFCYIFKAYPPYYPLSLLVTINTKLYENDKLLVSDDMHNNIRNKGKGRYSFWRNKTLYFSSSDNTNPITNNYKYQLKYSYKLFSYFSIVLTIVGIFFFTGLLAWKKKFDVELTLKTYIIVFLLLVFIFSIISSYWAHLYTIEGTNGFNKIYAIEDWLINYQGGFVRRGLSGELILQLARLTNINPTFYVFLLHSFFYGSFFIFSFLILRKQPSLLPYIFLIFSPFIFTYQISEHLIIHTPGYKKEIMYIVVLVFVAWSAISYKTKKFEKIFYLTLLAYPLLILSHEMLAIFLPYIVIVYVLKVDVTIKKVFTVIAFLIPSLISFSFTVYYSGNEEAVVGIYNSLEEYGIKISQSTCSDRTPGFFGPIDWLNCSIKTNMNDVSNHFLTFKKFFYWMIYSTGLALALAFVAYIPILNELKKLFKQKLVLILFLISIIGTIVLCIVAIDWGRFLYTNLVSLFILSLLTNHLIVNEKIADTKFFNMVRLFNLYKNKKLAMLIFISLVVIYYVSWTFPQTLGFEPFDDFPPLRSIANKILFLFNLK